ncbi:fatty-acid amide hydrolase 1-like [Penaeus indicus]|uniref:fatty-acid amide hydrolase 1-like n=1 Tax=Penaeus indicus TaxID=29960 RepID=UPI00300CDC19
MQCSKTKEKLQEAVEQRRKEVRAALDKLEASLSAGAELLTEERLAILALPPDILLHRLKEGHLTPTAVLRAFQAKAMVVTYRINCVTEFIPQAEDWASALEEDPHSRSLPLYGLPVSIKENFEVEGMDTTLGLAKYLYQPAPRHAAIVQVLRLQGAVPFCKTNVPQTLISYRCSNPVWGETLNPVDTQRTCGGSSGGEAALVGGGGSVLGVGSDVAGSVRIPAHFCGVVAIKPTSGRVSSRGLAKCVRGAVGVESAPGLLGRDVDIVVAGLQAVLEGEHMHSVDPTLPPLSWRGHLFAENRPLRVGWYDHDEVFPVTPGCRRAVTEARDAMVAAGHTLVPFTPTGVRRAWRLLTACFTADQGQTSVRLLENEQLDQAVETNRQLMSAPRFVRAVVRQVVSRKSPLMADLLRSDTSSSYQLWRVLGERKDYIDDLLEAWKANQLDVLLCPAFPMPAPKPSYPTRIMAAAVTTALYNYLDFPAGVVPVTHETEDDQAKLAEYPTDDLMFELVKEATAEAVGLPIGVQMVGLPWQEEVLCRAMKALQDALASAKEAK